MVNVGIEVSEPDRSEICLVCTEKVILAYIKSFCLYGKKNNVLGNSDLFFFFIYLMGKTKGISR